jgi:hypothetical protein
VNVVSQELSALKDRIEINELLARYCQRIDARDWPGVSALFTSTAALDYSAFGGPKGSVDEVLAFLSAAVASMRTTQHTVSTGCIDLNGDTATARTAAQVMLVSAAEDGSDHVLFTGLWYRDTLVRSAVGWQIAQRTQERSWMHNLPGQKKF